MVDASVNLMTSEASVSYDPAAAAPSALVEAIRGAGYGAELPAADRPALDEQEARDKAHHAEFVDLRRKAVVSLVLAGVAMVASMPLMAGGAGGHGGGHGHLRHCVAAATRAGGEEAQQTYDDLMYKSAR